jgi:hypothetical protein
MTVNCTMSPGACTAAMLQMLNVLPNNIVTPTLNSDRLPVAQLLLNSMFVRESDIALSSSSRAIANT